MQLESESILMLGQYRREVRELFGKVEIHWKGTDRMVLTANKILPNFYRNSNAGVEPVEQNPIYIIVPSRPIKGVWAHRDAGMRYGTAENHKTKEVLTPTVGIFKDPALLLICLNPLDEAGVAALEVGSLGM